jgi:hypothetical protein
MLDVAKTIWAVAKDLLGARAEMAKARRQRRDRAAEYFSNLARLIEETSAQLKKRKYPHGRCAELAKLANLMPRTLRGILSASEVQSHRKKLLAVHEIERLHSELLLLKDRSVERKLEKLDEAAGDFRALAAHLRVADEA